MLRMRPQFHVCWIVFMWCTTLALLCVDPGEVVAQGLKPSYWDQAIDFTGNREIQPNLKGTLEGEIAFIQNTQIGPKRGEVQRPLLVTDRAAYLLFFPVKASSKRYEVLARQADGKQLKIQLNAPWMEPRNDSGNTDGRPPVVYSKRAWSAVIPWEFMHHGLELIVEDEQGTQGRLAAEEFEFGPPIELVTQHVELGMLLPPDRVQINKWCNPEKNISPELALDYFQMVPVSKFTAGQYLPIHFPKVVLANGNVYTERSTFEGAGVYKGDMREQIAKGMVSTGINYANIGIPTSIGGTTKQPRPFRHTTVHTSAGMYTERDDDGNANAVFVRHGLSGGGGQLTLINTTGNEFSHEYGHDHGLPHYPGGKELSKHSLNSGWGYNMFKNRLIGNIAWNGKQPEEGDFPYTFGSDAMAGGKPMGKVSQFTLHTPFSLNMIQQKVGRESGVLAPDSPTGYRKWDAEKQEMTDFMVDSPKPDQFGVPVVTLLGMYDPVQPSEMPSFIYPALYGNWGNVFTPETLRKSTPALSQTTCSLEVIDDSGGKHLYPLDDKRHKDDVMNQFHINLPASIRYVQASIIFEADRRVELDTRKIEPPHGELPDPVIVGREHGFREAALRLNDMASFLVSSGYSDREQLRQVMEDYYGPIEKEHSKTVFEVGKVYRRRDGNYYQVQSIQSGKPIFRKLGDIRLYLSTERLALGMASKDYAKEEMKGESGVYYYVPVDHDHVIESEAPSPESAGWYKKGNYTKITVNGTTTRGVTQPIVLRGQINGRHVINRGAPVTESSRVRFTFHQEDNPKVRAGQYRIQFTGYAQAWHAKRLIESFQVAGMVQVK